MASIIVRVDKAIPDWYVIWSTNADSPQDWGSLEELTQSFGPDFMRAERVKKANSAGSSGPKASYGWADEYFVVQSAGFPPYNYARLPRTSLGDYLNALREHEDESNPEVTKYLETM